VQDRIVNVRAFGASGNGSTDDTEAVQSAADCAVSLFVPDAAGRAGVSLYFPSGSYLVERQIRINATAAPPSGGGIVIAGDGADASKVIAGTSAGIFAVTMTKPQSKSSVALQVHDIGMVAGVANAGTALDIQTTSPTTALLRGQGNHLIGMRIRHVNITASGAAHPYFAYGVSATGLFLPFLGDVHMNGAGGTACYAFSYSYGPMIDHSSCQGAGVAVEVMNAAEGEVVINSQFNNVGTGVKIQVVPGQVPGPSNDEAVIMGNTIAAQNRGIDLTWKKFVFVTGNEIHVPGNSAFVGVSLTNEGQTYVTNNIFTGSGNAGTGVLLTTDATTGRKPTIDTTIARNKFEGLATGVSIGSGVRNTVFGSNSTRTSSPLEDQGIGTVMLPSAADSPLSANGDRPQ
jgi:hypothetical protein